MGVSGEDQSDAIGGGEVPGVGMMGEKDGEKRGVPLIEDEFDGVVLRSAAVCPDDAKQLNGDSAGVNGLDLIQEQRNAACGAGVVECIGSAHDVVIALNHIRPAGSL